MTEPALVRLLIWLSPAFPTGGFAYSQGIEWAVKSGDVRCGGSLADWLADHFRHGGGRSEAMLLRAAYRAGADPGRLAQLAELALAVNVPRERAEETRAQGAAFLRAAQPWRPGWLGEALPYPVAVGALAATHAAGEDATCLAFLSAQASALVSAAVRLVPLGQSAGVAALAGLEPVLIEAAASARSSSLDDLGGCGFRAEIASMCHETQETRLFRS
jgi:urease accessory protein